MFALQPRKRFAKDTVLIVDGALLPARDHTIAEQPKNYRYFTKHQVVIDADTSLVVVIARPLAGSRNGCKAWEESGAKAAVGNTLTIADGGHSGTQGHCMSGIGPVEDAILVERGRKPAPAVSQSERWSRALSADHRRSGQ
jgi:hypothetical protein